MTPLTPKQQNILQYIKEHIKTKGYAPSIREIGQGMGLASSSTVAGHLNQLETKGYIHRDKHTPRAMTVSGQGNAITVKKNRNNIPTVISYEGRDYILRHSDMYQGPKGVDHGRTN